MSLPRFVNDAVLDLDGIWEYVARRNVRAADRLLERIHDVCRMLARQPLIGEACEEFGDGLRSFPVGDYVIFYKPLDKGALIVRVIHGARDLPSQFSEN